jgi:hypothetical protein
MMRRRRVNRRRVIIGATAGTAAVLIGKKAYDFGAPPSGPKACSFAFPDSPGDEIPGADGSQPGLAWAQNAGYINDASCLNRTAITGIVAIRSYEDVAAALRYARDRGLTVSTAGCRHTMGGQAFARGSLVLDMRGLNRIDVDRAKKIITVQAGATWIEVQRRLDETGLAVIAMQSFSGFTIGGTLSVNAHGVAHRPGPIAATVRSIRIMMSDGRIVEARPDQNTDLFSHAIGGYGLFGVILEAVIDVQENETYRREITYTDYRSIPDIYAEIERSGDAVPLLYARSSSTERRSLLCLTRRKIALRWSSISIRRWTTATARDFGASRSSLSLWRWNWAAASTCRINWPIRRSN